MKQFFCFGYAVAACFGGDEKFPIRCCYGIHSLNVPRSGLSVYSVLPRRASNFPYNGSLRAVFYFIFKKFVIASPILRQNNKADTQENIKLADEMKAALAKIPESKDWGNKINGFPWSYLDADTNSETYSFDVTLLDAKKKTIGTKKIYFRTYLQFDGRGKQLKNRWYPEISDAMENVSSYTYSLELRTLKDGLHMQIDVNDADTDTIYVSVENPLVEGFKNHWIDKKARPADEVTAITPLKSDGSMSYGEACSAIRSGNHNGAVKIIGRTTESGDKSGDMICALSLLSGALQRAEKPVSIDMSELEVIPTKADSNSRNRKPTFSSKNLRGIVLPKGLGAIPDYAFKDCTALESITIPASVDYIGKEAFSGCKSLKTLTILAPFRCSEDSFKGCKFDTVNFVGTKDDWKALKKVIKAKNVNYNYKGE